MSEIVLKESDLPEKLTEILKNIISPIKVAYFTAADENLNFKCIFSTTPLYKKGEKYSIYNLTPLFRLVLSKADIIPEKSLREIFEKHNDQISYILDWEEIKKVLIFDLNELDYFEDQSLVKDLVKYREEILESLDKAVYE
jgi:hypothetical protein